MDTLNFNPSGNPADMTYNFLINYLFNYSIFIVAFFSMFLMEAIKYFSEDKEGKFNWSKKLYGITMLIIILLLDVLFNGITFDIKYLLLRVVCRIAPIFIIYNIFLKQLFEGLRKVLSRKIKEWTGDSTDSGDINNNKQ